MSYDRINPDGSITRMPGSYNPKKAKAIVQSTIDTNDRLRAEKKKKHEEAFAEKSERIAAYFKALNNDKLVKIEDYA